MVHGLFLRTKNICDGAYQHNSLPAGCGGIFWYHFGNFVLDFANKVSLPSYLVEFVIVVNSMKIAVDKGWLKLRLETDFITVVQAFSNPSLVPSYFKNQWFSCLVFFAHINLFISHIHREGKSCTGFLANIGIFYYSLTIFESIPIGIRKDFVKNRWEMFFLKIFFFFMGCFFTFCNASFCLISEVLLKNNKNLFFITSQCDLDLFIKWYHFQNVDFFLLFS